MSENVQNQSHAARGRPKTRIGTVTSRHGAASV